MAEFVSGLVEGVIGRLASYAYGEIELAWGVEDDLEELKGILEHIKLVLLDAEQKQHKSETLKKWMEELQHCCYDAEDILDEFDAETQRRQLRDRSTLKSKVRYSSLCVKRLLFRFKMAHKVMNLKERMDKIDEQKNRFNLSDKPDTKTIVHRKKETHSHVQVTSIVGRREDKRRMIDLLLSSSEVGKIAVVPIVGIGGLGKTTLAKMVFMDEKVDTHFELKVWISVEVEFDVKTIVKDIIQSISPRETKFDNMKMEQLQRQLRAMLENKRCLFVFDDVWNLTRPQWLELRELLEEVSHGSRVIVTSRDKRVATIMAPSLVPEFNLKRLSDEDAVTLFMKQAFDQGEEKKHPHLVEIGKEIVKKCGGNPLAVKSMGSLLNSTTEDKKWETVRDSEIWKMEKEETILPSLRISYDLMPSSLKQCFAYCSIFPKNYQFNDLELIQLWIANGLIQGRINQELEEIGEEYWKELWSRSFFEEVQEDLLFVTFKMHDLIHELSLSVAQSQSSVMKPGAKDIYDRTRHLSFTDPTMLTDDFAKNIDKLTGLRTIMFPIKKEGPAGEAFLSLCLSMFKRLRVLYLHDSSFEELPNSVGNLKHLRFLHFCGNKRLKRLPNSVCNLLNLQSLGLARCDEFEELPKDIKKMINLRFLDITTKQKDFPNGGMGLLGSLRSLFIGDCLNLELLNEDIDSLKSLKKLFIDGCPKLKHLPRGIMGLGSLEELLICNCESLTLDLEVMESSNQGSSRNLKVRSLTFSRLPRMVNFPNWLQGSATSLRSIAIEDCPNFRGLPHWLQHCSSLRKLSIEDCPRVSPLPEGGEGLPNSLRELRIENCGELSSLCAKDGGDWLKIAHVPEIYIDGSRIK